MIITRCHFEPVLLNSRFFRRGIILKLENEEGKESVAEVSPLPGFNRENVEEALEQLKKLKPLILSQTWTKENASKLNGLYPSVHFGVESGLLNLLDPIQPREKIQSYALLIGSPDEILQRAYEAKEEGFQDAKMKVGHLPFSTAKNLINELDKHFRLRLDFNRKWNVEKTIKLCSNYQIEYVEEPAQNPKDLSLFPFPFALDESLRDFDYAPLLKLENLTTLILKPTMIYPITSYLNLGKKVVITSSFEGEVGNHLLKTLISRYKLEGALHGLDTLRYMSNQLLEKAAT